VTPRLLRPAAWLSLANAFLAVPAIALLSSLAVDESVLLRALHAAVLLAAVAAYAVTLFTFRALLHARGVYEADPLIKAQLWVCAVEGLLDLHWALGFLGEVGREGAALAVAAVYWAVLIAYARRLQRLGDDLHGLRDRLAGALIVASVGGLALSAVSIPMVGWREAAAPDSVAWVVAILVAALATLLGYVRASVTVARIFFREARRTPPSRA
jgi:hypothetical protein